MLKKGENNPKKPLLRGFDKEEFYEKN